VINLSVPQVEHLDNGQYRVSLDIEATKFYADAEGNETTAKFETPVDIGLFLRSPADRQFSTNDVIYLNKHQISSGISSLELIVDQLPAFAGVLTS